MRVSGRGPRRIALVVHPHTVSGRRARSWRRCRDALRAGADVCGELQTYGGGADLERIGDLVKVAAPEVVVVVGGDGTVNEVLQVLMRCEASRRPALAVVPVGTANNVARSLGLRSFRQGGDGAVGLAVEAILAGAERRIDLGRVVTKEGARYFVGAFALGMDADILATRNQLRRRLRLGRLVGGYPLYLASCGLNLFRRHGVAARLRIDEWRGAGCCPAAVSRDVTVYNLLLANAPIYAGEFRFDGENSCDDGALDLHLFTGALDYLRRYPTAWRRHVRHSRGLEVQGEPELQRVRGLRVELASPVASQVDGEEWLVRNSYEIEVRPSALEVYAPAVSADRRRPPRVSAALA